MIDQTYKIGYGWVRDNNGNQATIAYWGSESRAIESLKTLVNCKDCLDCIDCKDCLKCLRCVGCIRCFDCGDLTTCYGCDGGILWKWEDYDRFRAGDQP